MGGARVTTLVTLRKCTLGNKREIKTLKFVLASRKGFKGGLAWIKPSKKDMAVTFSYSEGGESHREIVRGAIAWSLPPFATCVAAMPFSPFSNVVQGEIPKKRIDNAKTQAILLRT